MTTTCLADSARTPGGRVPAGDASAVVTLCTGVGQGVAVLPEAA